MKLLPSSSIPLPLFFEGERNYTNFAILFFSAFLFLNLAFYAAMIL
jgi:hypothetical protein